MPHLIKEPSDHWSPLHNSPFQRKPESSSKNFFSHCGREYKLGVFSIITLTLILSPRGRGKEIDIWIPTYVGMGITLSKRLIPNLSPGIWGGRPRVAPTLNSLGFQINLANIHHAFLKRDTGDKVLIRNFE